MDHDNSFDISEHLGNVADNLQLVADLGYGDVALAIVGDSGDLKVHSDARPMTAVAAIAHSREDRVLSREDEPEAYDALDSGQVVHGERRRITRGLSYLTVAYPICPSGECRAVVVRDLVQQVLDAPGTMETVFMRSAEDLLKTLRDGPLQTIGDGKPFKTVRRAGDGVMRTDHGGTVTYASPNAVSIMRLAGHEGGVSGVNAREIPGGLTAVAPLIGHPGAHAIEVEVADRVIGYRAISSSDGILVLVEDVTEARRREQEIKVKEATIREVHHRVKNNLQTIASLLRIQARRSETEEARRSLAEAVERVSSMAVVHDMLAASTEELVDFTDASRTVVDMVSRGLAGDADDISVTVEGASGNVPAHVATSLALVIAELVHNAIEHGFSEHTVGRVTVELRRLPHELSLVVRDDGVGLPEEFDAEQSSNLGLEIVRTIVHDDLRGTLTFSGGRGTTVSVRIPLDTDEDLKG
ncbi:MAG: histidine kinase N-terminal domain-containing protein [Actinomycetota bacterium]|nr:histidine kinase N-terminal domain-containing protein [Actinomycetota bacterium]